MEEDEALSSLGLCRIVKLGRSSEVGGFDVGILDQLPGGPRKSDRATFYQIGRAHV